MLKTIHSARHQSLTEYLTEQRRRSGLTQAQVARALGRHQPFVANIESGQRRLDVVELLELADVLQFDVVELLRELKRVNPAPRRRTKAS